jgi:biotin operon repressor
LEERVGEVVYGEELAAVAGISEWARRVRELREEGLAIEELGGSRYRLAALPDND